MGFICIRRQAECCICLFFLILTFLLAPHSLEASSILHQKISISLVQKNLHSIFDVVEKKYNVQIYAEFPLPNDVQSIDVHDIEIIEFLVMSLNNYGIKNCAILADDQSRVVRISNIESMVSTGNLSTSTIKTDSYHPKLPSPSAITEKTALPASEVMKNKISLMPPYPDTLSPLPGTNTPIVVSEIEARNKNAKFPESITLPGMDTPVSLSEIEARNKSAKPPESFTLPGQDTPVLLSEVEARNNAARFPGSVDIPDSDTSISPDVMEKRSKVTLLPEVPTLPTW